MNGPVSPAEFGFEVLYHHAACLAVAKPAGVLTQAPRGIDSLEARLRNWLSVSGEGYAAPESARRPEDVYLGIPHRLDRPVSGVMLFALRKRMARKLAQQFERRQVKKTYWACVTGHVQPPTGIWEDFLRKIPDVAEAEIVPPDHPEGQRARLRYRTLSSGSQHTLLEIQLETGRMHQIRVQAAWRGYPVVGDRQYGALLPFSQATDPREQQIALHAHSIQFRDPGLRPAADGTLPLPQAIRPQPASAQSPAQGVFSSIEGEHVTVQAPPPDTWQALL